MPTNGFSITPLKAKLLAGEQKATESLWDRKRWTSTSSADDENPFASPRPPVQKKASARWSTGGTCF